MESAWGGCDAKRGLQKRVRMKKSPRRNRTINNATDFRPLPTVARPDRTEITRRVQYSKNLIYYLKEEERRLGRGKVERRRARA